MELNGWVGGAAGPDGAKDGALVAGLVGAQLAWWGCVEGGGGGPAWVAASKACVATWTGTPNTQRELRAPIRANFMAGRTPASATRGTMLKTRAMKTPLGYHWPARRRAVQTKTQRGTTRRRRSSLSSHELLGAMPILANSRSRLLRLGGVLSASIKSTNTSMTRRARPARRRESGGRRFSE